ncbi:MAG: hypothetical protein NC094_00170 [Bacteroidales bacterium]|nr:hypothetical protein [Lachnoclostridium sp.]MCM1384654.1 hypothetical protein [Lachnoclostridium sp.]MCM1463807.1 hypothetical protein [Bacteroidales bacterium]MCM1536583.1 hypothetical protein [Clostridium sp.]
MTENEFLHLEIGTVVSSRFDEENFFVIYDTDQMGTEYGGKRARVYGAKQIDGNMKSARIDIGNCQFWKIEGRMPQES